MTPVRSFWPLGAALKKTRYRRGHQEFQFRSQRRCRVQDRRLCAGHFWLPRGQNRGSRAGTGVACGVVPKAESALESLRADYTKANDSTVADRGRDRRYRCGEAALGKLSDGAETIIFFGTGGSSLGGQTLAQIAGWGIPHTATKAPHSRPRIRSYDNLDGGTLEAMLTATDFGKTRFVVTSKSGGTAETLAQAIATISAIQGGGAWRSYPLAVSRYHGARRFLAGRTDACAVPVLRYSAARASQGIGGRLFVSHQTSATAGHGTRPQCARYPCRGACCSAAYARSGPGF